MASLLPPGGLADTGPSRPLMLRRLPFARTEALVAVDVPFKEQPAVASARRQIASFTAYDRRHRFVAPRPRPQTGRPI